MTGEPNVFSEGGWEFEHGPVRGTRVGAAAGAKQLGCTVYELDPGGQATPYHVHHGNEEVLIVLAGALELRTPAGVRELTAGAVAAFAVGTQGAHRVRNASDERALYLMVSTMHFPDVAEQLDTGTVLAMKGAADGWAFPAGSDGDYMGLTAEAVRADQGG